MSTSANELTSGQCGLCRHFGEAHKDHPQDVAQIRNSHRAKLDILEECGHPIHATLHLKVNAASGCDGFTPISS